MSDQQLLERINAACKQGIENYRIGESKSVIVGSLEEIEELLAEPAEAPAPAQPIAPNRDSNWLNELPTEPTTVVHVPVPEGNESRYVEVLQEQSQAAQATPCNCCADLALAAAEFADSTRVDNHEEAKRHRERYIDILIKHATTPAVRAYSSSSSCVVASPGATSPGAEEIARQPSTTQSKDHTVTRLNSQSGAKEQQ